jgi:tryptophanase
MCKCLRMQVPAELVRNQIAHVTYKQTHVKFVIAPMQCLEHLLAECSSDEIGRS